MFNKNEYDKQYIKDNYSVGKVIMKKENAERIKVIAKEHDISFSALAYAGITEYIKAHYGIDLDAGD